MNNRIIVIHSSEIISQGLFSIIKGLFDIEAILMPALDDLKNYHEFKNTQLIILADAGLDPKHFSEAIESIHKYNSVKIIKIRESFDMSDCKNDCDCCLAVQTSKSKIYDLLNPYLHHDHGNSKKRTSTSLTEREIDVLKLVAFGKTNKEIASELFISFHTVISHRKNITEKLGIKSISGLTVYAILNNLIDTNNMDSESLI